MLSPLFVDVAASGDITTRNQQLVQVITGEDKTFWLTQKVITVRMLGDIAVANGTYTLHHKVNGSRWTKRACSRMCSSGFVADGSAFNSQRTALRADNNASGKQKKSSAGDMPFHIPFFSKSDKGPQ